MSATTPAAWESDPFWKEVVGVMCAGKKLRADAYLQRLSPEDLDQLRLVLSSSGTLQEQIQAAPKWRGGAKDGELPGINTLSNIGSAVRQMTMLQGLERRQLVDAATRQRCQGLGLNSQMTDAVLQVVGEEVMVQSARGVVGDFALKAAGALMKRSELDQTDRKIALLEKKVASAKEVMESTLSPEDQRARLKEILK